MTNLFEAAEMRESEETGPLEVIVRQEIGLLDWNFEELNRQLDIQLQKYDGLVFTPEEMKEAKATRANLNKVAKAINDRKIEIRKQFCAPYDRFADQAKQLVEKIKTVSGKIDDQVKDFEAKEKEEKRKRITDYWIVNGIRQIDISQIWDDRWLNASMKDTEVRKAMDMKKEQIRNDLVTITELQPTEKLDWVMTSYMKTLNVGQSLQAWEEYQKQIQKVEELRKTREEAEKKAQEAKPIQVEEVPAEPQKAPETARNEPQSRVKTTWWVYNVTLEGDTEQMKQLAAFIKHAGIQMAVNSRQKEER